MANPVHERLGQSLRNRALMANALCAIAEEEAQAGDVARATQSVQAIRGVLGEVSIILAGDTDGIPVSAMQDAAEMLHGLDGRITAVEKALGPRLIQ